MEETGTDIYGNVMDLMELNFRNGVEEKDGRKKKTPYYAGMDNEVRMDLRLRNEWMLYSLSKPSMCHSNLRINDVMESFLKEKFLNRHASQYAMRKF